MSYIHKPINKIANFFLLNKKILEKSGIDFSKPFGNFLNITHNVTSLGILIIAVFYGIDFLTFSGKHFYAIFLPVLELIFLDVPAETAPMQLFFYIATMFALAVAIIFAFAAYFFEAENISWIDMIHSEKITNAFIGRAWVFLSGLIGIIIFYVGGYFLTVVLVEATFLHNIPAIELLQVTLTARVLGFVSIAVYQVFSSLIPHTLINSRRIYD